MPPGPARSRCSHLPLVVRHLLGATDHLGPSLGSWSCLLPSTASRPPPGTSSSPPVEAARCHGRSLVDATTYLPGARMTARPPLRHLTTESVMMTVKRYTISDSWRVGCRTSKGMLMYHPPRRLDSVSLKSQT
jgi:hypothetical protein